MGDSEAYRTPCAHIFHGNCFAKWQTARPFARGATCPICRTLVAEEDCVINLHGGSQGREGEACETNGRTRAPELPEAPIGTALNQDGGTTLDPADCPLQRPPLNLRIRVEPGPDLGLVRSLPPPNTFDQLSQAWAPILVLVPPLTLTAQQAPFFQGTCPWIQAGVRDAYGVAEAAAIQLGRYEAGQGEGVCCARCRRPVGGHNVVSAANGQTWHEWCWSEVGPRERPRVLWQGKWPDERGSGGQDPRAHPSEEDPEEYCILALGVSGSVLQAVVDEMTKLKLKVVIRAVSSVPAQHIPGDSSAEAVIAADCAWGTRNVMRAATLSWISPWYQPLLTRRTVPRRLLLGEFIGQTEWNPHRQPVLAIDGGEVTNLVGLLVSPEAAERCRNVIENIRVQTGDRTVLSTRERLFQAESTALGHSNVATDVIQITVGCARALTAEQLRAHLLSCLPAQLRRPGEILWWTSSREADYVFAPTAARAIPAVIAELKKGITEGFPAIRVCATMHGIAIGGINPNMVSGLLSVVGLGSDTHGLNSVKAGPMHHPFRIAKQGRLACGEPIEGWKISYAEVDNEPLYVVRDTTFTGTQIRAAIANTLGHPCAPSLAAIVEPGGSAPVPVWLIRLPAVARPEADRWQAAGGHLRIAGCSTQAQRAPPVQALDEGSGVKHTNDGEAAELQRAWRLECAPKHAPVYFGIKKQSAGGQAPEEVRRMREAAWVDRNTPGSTKVWHATMPGIRTQIKLWDTGGEPTGRAAQDPHLLSYLATCGTAGDLFENELLQIPVEPNPRDNSLSLELLTGDFVLALLQAGSEIQVDTATHTGRTYLTSNKWVLIGLSRTERRRIASLGVGEDWAVHMHGPAPLAVWTGSDERKEALSEQERQRIERITGRRQTEAHSEHTGASDGSRTDDGDLRVPEPPHGAGGQNGESEEGGLRWKGPCTIEGWLARQLQGRDEETQAGQEERMGREEEFNTAAEALEMFCPSPCRRKVARLVDWLREHTAILCREPDKTPIRWMWEVVLYLWALEEAGIAELRHTDPAAQEDLLAQVGLPLWASRAFPMTQWTQGQRGMTPGRAFLGMNIRNEDKPRSLIALVPAQRPYTIDNLGRLTEQAGWRPDIQEDVMMGGGAEGTPRSTPREEQPNSTIDNKRPAGGPPNNERPEKGPRSKTSTAADHGYLAITHERFGADEVTAVTGLQPDTEEHRMPKIGRGVVNIQATDGTMVGNSCAVSSIVQLLAREYHIEVTSEATADLAVMVRRWEHVPENATIEISDAWWYILPRYLPIGPWPELLVMRNNRGRLDPEGTIRLTIPGPTEAKMLAVIGDGGHFDPVWWPTSRGLSAVRPRRAPKLAHIARTVTPDFGPAVGMLGILGAEYGGRIAFSPEGAKDGCTEQEGRGVALVDKAWRPWVQKMRQVGIDPGDIEEWAVVVLACVHPQPPYPALGSLPGALRMLAPNARIQTPEGGLPSGILVLAFDQRHCHVGRMVPNNTQEVLTRLRNIWDPAVARGHQGR